MNQSPFLQTGDDFDLPSDCRLHPFDKGARVLGVAQRTCAHDTYLLHAKFLRGSIKTREYLDGVRHRVGSEYVVAKYGFSEPCNLAILVNHCELAPGKFSDLESDRVGANIYCRKNWHRD